MSPTDSISAILHRASNMEGWLRKRGRKYHQSHWNERYFILNGRTLSYYVRRGDYEPKGEFQLFPECKISDIVVEGKDIKKPSHRSNGETKSPGLKKLKRYSSDDKDTTPNASNTNYERKDGKKGIYYTFRVTWPAPSENETGSEEADAPPSTPTSYPRDLQSSDDYDEIIPLSVLERTENAGDCNVIRKAANNTGFSHVKQASLNKHLNDEITEKLKGDFEPMSPPLSPVNLQRGNSTGRKHVKDKTSAHTPPRVSQQLVVNSSSIVDEPQKIIAALEEVKKARYKKMQRKIVKSGGLVAATGALVTTTVLTGGLNLATLLTVIGISAAAGTSGAVASRTFLRSKQLGWTLRLAAMTLEDAQRWRNAIMNAIASDSDDDTISERASEADTPAFGGTWANLFALSGRNPASVFIPNAPSLASDEGSYIGRHRSSAYAHSGTTWKPMTSGWTSLLGVGSTGLRVFEEEDVLVDAGTNPRFKGTKSNFSQLISVKGSSPLLKAQIVLDSNPVDAFMCLMSYNQVRCRTDEELAPASSQWSSFRVVESLDDHTDIIHLVFRPLFLFPSWTTPRDFCIMRYWRLDDDGCYVLFYEPVKHRECPPNPNYVRGEMHGVYTIAPLKEKVARQSWENRHLRMKDESSQCMLIHMVQTDPKGWIPTMKLPFLANQKYSDAFGVSSLLQILDLQDALASERFVSVSVEENNGNLGGVNKKLMKSISAADMNLNNTNELGTDSDYYIHLSQSQSTTDESVDRRNYDFAFSSRELCTSPSKNFFSRLKFR